MPRLGHKLSRDGGLFIFVTCGRTYKVYRLSMNLLRNLTGYESGEILRKIQNFI